MPAKSTRNKKAIKPLKKVRPWYTGLDNRLIQHVRENQIDPRRVEVVDPTTIRIKN